MRGKSRLTDNAIMYISVGFQQHCLLQVLSLRHTPSHALEMVVYDGTVYAGAIYRPPHTRARAVTVCRSGEGLPVPAEQRGHLEEEPILPRQLDVIRVSPRMVDKSQPLHIGELQIVERGLLQILGNQVLSLDQYMKRRKFFSCIEVDSDEDHPHSHPIKKIKNNTQDEPSRSLKEEGDREPLSVQPEEPPGNGLMDQPGQLSLKEGANGSTDSMASKEQSLDSQPQKHGIFPNVIPEESGKDSVSQPAPKKGRIIPNSMSEPKENIEQECKISGIQQEIQSIKENPIDVKQSEEILLQEQAKKEEQDEVQQVKTAKSREAKKRTVIDLIQESPAEVTVQSSIKSVKSVKIQRSMGQSQTMIEDLYERMHRFRLLCRVNFISHFTSKKGNPCTKLMLVDERGDEIACIIYDKHSERAEGEKLLLLKGRTYIFENGDVEKNQDGFLSISMSSTGVQLTKNILSSFHPSKMLRVGEIENLEGGPSLEKSIGAGNKSINNRRTHSKQTHICGIFKGFRDEPKLCSNQFRVVGTLCDPDHETSVNFTLFLDELSSFPQSGAVLSLHNMHVQEYERTLRVEQSKRSYYLVQNQNNHPYLADLRQTSEQESWKLKDYRNLSEVRFVRRTIAEVKGLLCRMLEHDWCYSELDCNISTITVRKEYLGCAVCHRETKEDKPRTYCYHCKKVEPIVKRFIFSSQVADSTGSLDIKIFQEDIAPFINTEPEDYASQTANDRAALLELSTYQNILLRVKSEQLVGGPAHLVAKAEKISHRRGLDQIKEQSIQSKTAYQSPWL